MPNVSSVKATRPYDHRPPRRVYLRRQLVVGPLPQTPITNNSFFTHFALSSSLLCHYQPQDLTFQSVRGAENFPLLDSFNWEINRMFPAPAFTVKVRNAYTPSQVCLFDTLSIKACLVLIHSRAIHLHREAPTFQRRGGTKENGELGPIGLGEEFPHQHMTYRYSKHFVS